MTTFRDSSKQEVEKDVARPISNNNSPLLPYREEFNEIELKETPQKKNVFQTGMDNTRYKSKMKDANENLPYTEFEGK